MGHQARLKAQRRASKLQQHVSKAQRTASRDSALSPDYGSHLLRQNIPTNVYVEPGAGVSAHYYPETGSADFHLSFGGYCASIWVPCEENQVQAICDRLSNGFSGVLRPDVSKAYTTPRTKERVVPVVFQDLPAFMATVDSSSPIYC